MRNGHTLISTIIFVIYFNFKPNSFDQFRISKGASEDRSDESEEIIAEKILRDLTREYADIFIQIFNPKQSLGKT